MESERLAQGRITKLLIDFRNGEEDAYNKLFPLFIKTYVLLPKTS